MTSTGVQWQWQIEMGEQWGQWPHIASEFMSISDLYIYTLHLYNAKVVNESEAFPV